MAQTAPGSLVSGCSTAQVRQTKIVMMPSVGFSVTSIQACFAR
jgi:hypothetical protein